MKHINRILLTVVGVFLMIILYLFALNGRYYVSSSIGGVFDKWNATLKPFKDYTPKETDKLRLIYKLTGPSGKKYEMDQDEFNANIDDIIEGNPDAEIEIENDEYYATVALKNYKQAMAEGWRPVAGERQKDSQAEYLTRMDNGKADEAKPATAAPMTQQDAEAIVRNVQGMVQRGQHTLIEANRRQVNSKHTQAQSNIKNLYDALKDEYDLGTEEQFRKSLQDASARKNLYDAIKDDYEVGTEEDFNNSLGY